MSVDELASDLSDLAKQEGHQIVEPIDLHMQVDITILSRFGSGRCLGGHCVVTYLDLGLQVPKIVPQVHDLIAKLGIWYNES